MVTRRANSLLGPFAPSKDIGLTLIGPGTMRRPRRCRAMPRFYFHLLNDVDAPDEEGVELPDLEAARAHALREARVTFGETAKDLGRVVLHHRIDIEDGQGAVLETVYFRDAVAVED